MKIKKIIALSVAMMIAAVSASAASITETQKNIAGAQVTVKATGFEAGETVVARILYPGVTLLADGKQTKTVAWIGETVANEAGEIEFVAGMPEDTNKQIVEFSLELIAENGDKTAKPLKWVDNDGLEETVLNIKQAADATAALNEVVTKADALDITFIEPWKDMTPAQKEKIATSLYGARGDFAIFDDAVEKMNYLVLQEAMNASASQTEFFEFLDKYKTLLDESLFDETVNGLEGEIKEEFEARFYNMRKNLDGSEDAFKYTLKEALVAAHIAKLDRNAPLINILEAYADVLIKENAAMKDVMDDFKSADEEIKLAVCDALLEKRETSLSKICSIIEDVLYDDGDSGSSGGGNGGGGSSGSGFSGTGAGAVTGGYAVSYPAGVSPVAPGQTSAAKINFADIGEFHYAYNGVLYLAKKGVINGYNEDGKILFKPDNDMTREEFVKMVLLAFGYEVKTATGNFADVAPGSWYAPYVNTAADLGVVNGVGDGRFGVGTKITREQMCTVIYRIARQKQISLKGGNSGEFADKNSISEYALEAVQALKGAGIVSGDEVGNFNPLANATRANAAKILYGILTAE